MARVLEARDDHQSVDDGLHGREPEDTVPRLARERHLLEPVFLIVSRVEESGREMENVSVEQEPVHTIRTDLEDEAHKGQREENGFGPDQQKVGHGTEPVEGLLVEAHVLLLFEEDTVRADKEKVAPLKPPQALPPHEAWLQGYLHSCRL
jgi:hypothetical protein